MKKKFITSKKAIEKHYGLPSHWSPESHLTQKILITILQHLEKGKYDEPEEDSRYSTIVGKGCYFRCANCDGNGYVRNWGSKNKDEDQLEFTDCPNCKGEGASNIDVLDKRKNSKDRELSYVNEC